jgi:hypothetical protein
MELTTTARAYTAEGYITLGDLRTLLDEHREAPDNAAVYAGLGEDHCNVDTVRVEWTVS